MSGIISEPADLAEFCDQAADAGHLAMDTEFMRERTYYPELCLIQIALPHRIVLIDTQALDLQPLSAVLTAGPEKIFHACLQDQEVLATRFDAPVRPLFDTQVAAALCGYAPQLSYAGLVKDLCQVSLAKGATRTNWAKRPLSAEQVEYAADDVRYLADLRAKLSQRLTELGRQQWFAEDMQNLETPGFAVSPDQAWRKVKGRGRLRGQQLAALQQLAAWREQRAMDKDRPRRWIASDQSLLALAEHCPRDDKALNALADVEPGLRKHHGRRLLQILATAADCPPPANDAQIPDPARVKPLQRLLQSRAQGLDMDATMLATRAELNALALGQTDGLRVLDGWRHEVLGAELLAAAA